MVELLRLGGTSVDREVGGLEKHLGRAMWFKEE